MRGCGCQVQGFGLTDAGSPYVAWPTVTTTVARPLDSAPGPVHVPHVPRGRASPAEGLGFRVEGLGFGLRV